LHTALFRMETQYEKVKEWSPREAKGSRG